MHNNEDRGMMKWQAFHSVISEDEINKSIKNRCLNEKPDLSEDQISEIENIIVDAFNNKKEVVITVYSKIKNIIDKGFVTKLDPMHKAIYLNKKMIPFNNIIKIDYIEN